MSEVLAALTRLERERQGADPEPSALAIDSQSVKGVAFLPAETTGVDGGKKTHGRKRHIVVEGPRSSRTLIGLAELFSKIDQR